MIIATKMSRKNRGISRKKAIKKAMPGPEDPQP
jgi:hypothetical protein